MPTSLSQKDHISWPSAITSSKFGQNMSKNKFYYSVIKAELAKLINKIEPCTKVKKGLLTKKILEYENIAG